MKSDSQRTEQGDLQQSHMYSTITRQTNRKVFTGSNPPPTQGDGVPSAPKIFMHWNSML